MLVFAGRLTLACPDVGGHRRTFLQRSFLFLQLWTASLPRLTRMICMMGGTGLYNCCFLGSGASRICSKKHTSFLCRFFIPRTKRQLHLCIKYNLLLFLFFVITQNERRGRIRASRRWRKCTHRGAMVWYLWIFSAFLLRFSRSRFFSGLWSFQDPYAIFVVTLSANALHTVTTPV